MKLQIRPNTEYILGTDLSDSITTFCQKLGARTVVICDQAVEQMGGGELGFELLTFPGGEAAKTRETKQRLEDELLARKMGRDTLIVGLGGGVTTDLVGFLASTYMRGVPLVLAPTTLLAMVDAAIGGKAAVDTPHGKNLIGAFYSPKAIFANLDTLKTLPEKEWLNGLAEIWKAGLMADPRIWRLKNWRSHLLEAIELSARVKIDCVEKDFL
jgi:3-dehydroquinate synthetase